MSEKKTQKLDFIPISTLFNSKGFDRNFKLMMTENKGSTNTLIKDAVTEELIAKAITGVNVTKNNPENAKCDRKKKPAAKTLYEYKEKWVKDNAYERGWKKSAKNQFGISYPTINKILKNL